MSDDFERALKATRGQECERGGACKFKSIIEQMCPYCQSKIKPRERFTTWVATSPYTDGLREVYLPTPPHNEHPV